MFRQGRSDGRGGVVDADFTNYLKHACMLVWMETRARVEVQHVGQDDVLTSTAVSLPAPYKFAFDAQYKLELTSTDQ